MSGSTTVNRAAKTRRAVFFAFIAALNVCGWGEGILLAMRGQVSDALWWWIGALIMAVAVIRRRKTFR